MDPQQRRNEIYKILAVKRDTTVEELSEKFNKSVTTIYNDIKILERNNMLQKTYGGVELSTPEEAFDYFYNRIKKNQEIKQALAAECIKLISSNDIIAIDASTTSNYIAKELIKEDKKEIKIVTNSAVILNDSNLIKKDNIELIIIGGYLDKKMACMISDVQEEFLSKIRINKFFFSPYGISEKFGIMDSFAPLSCKLKKFLHDNSQQSICVASSEKFSITGTYNWLPIEKLNTIVTDECLDYKTASLLINKGIELIRAKLKRK